MSNLEPNIDHYIITPLFLLLLVGGLIGVVTFLFLLRFRRTPGVKYWLVWQVAASIWAFTYAFEFAATDIETKIMWSKFSYFGIVYGPVSFLLFSLAFSSRFKFFKKKYVILVFAFASLFILSPFTNDLHHLHWRSYSINPETNATNYVYGPIFWIMTFFAYFALVSGIINIFLLYSRLSEYYKRQITVLLIASFLPLIGNIIYIFHINPLPGFDWTPFSFLLTGILIAIDISHFKMFDLVPFGRSKLFDILPDPILIIDNRQRIADFNPAMKDLIELVDKELVGKSVDEIFPKWKKMFREIVEVSDFQTIISHEVKGIMCYFDLNSLSLYDHRNQSNGRLVVLKDITSRIKADEEITETHISLIDEIQEKERLILDLDAFSHTVAHDLRNMLGAIVGASDLIISDINDMKKEDFLNLCILINQTATKTMHVTTELLTLASVRQQEIKPVPVSIPKVIEDSMTRLTNMIEQYKAIFLVPETCPLVLGYEGWLEEVYINYVSNAIKYGGTPPVIQFGSEIIAGNKVKCWIKDNGKGLSEEEIALLFNKFTRLETLRVEGHGLGLSIVKRIIEKLSGEVGVESQNIPGEGSTFYFILPMANQMESESEGNS